MESIQSKMLFTISQCHALPSPIQLSDLPNELLSIILANIDILKLILLRGVNTRWQAVIEALCQLKRSLFLTTSVYTALESLWLCPEGFEAIRLINDRIAASPEFCAFIHRLFPNVQNLAIDGREYGFDANTLFTLLNQWKLTTLAIRANIDYYSDGEALCDHINSIESLKQLSLGNFIKATLFRLTPTFNRLERFTFESINDELLANMAELSRLLGPNGTNFVYDTAILDSQLHNSFGINPQLFGQLTDLELWDSECDRHTWRMLCEHATKLHTLIIQFEDSVSKCNFGLTCLKRLCIINY